MSDDSSQEKTEDPTPKRKKDAKEKGDVARSRDLNTMVILLFGAASLMLFGPYLVEQMTWITKSAYHFEHENIFNDMYIFEKGTALLNRVLIILAPFLVILLLAAIIGPIALGGWSISLKPLTPKLERLNVLKGLKKIFAVRGLVELAKALLKFLIVASFSGSLLWSQYDTIIHLGFSHTNADMGQGLYLLCWLTIAMSSTLLIIVAIDVPYQIYEFTKKIKMTKQEIKDEYKESEGKPEVKGHIRRTQQEMAQQRMMADVPKADVVITNPTHYSVALKYDEEAGGAPRVVAKGKDFIAFQIRDIARNHDVTVLPAPQLARAIYFSTKLNQEIPHGLYIAVAQVLAYVFQLKRFRQRKGGRPKDLPKLEIPEEFHYD